MPDGAEEAQNVRQPAEELHEPADDPRPSGIHRRIHSEHHLNGKSTVTQGTMMKDVVENQRNVMGTLDIDKLDDLRD